MPHGRKPPMQHPATPRNTPQPPRPRPRPPGKITPPEVITQIFVLLGAGLATAYGLDVWAGHETPIMLYLALGGSFISYIYSAPPLKLKQSGWAGNYALGSSYIALPWWAGQVGGRSAGVVGRGAGVGWGGRGGRGAGTGDRGRGARRQGAGAG